jgi:hypothetical protein
MFPTDASDASLDPVVAIDFQLMGYGRLAYELLYFFTWSIEATTEEADRELLHFYYQALAEVNPSLVKQYSHDTFLREWHLAVMELTIHHAGQIGHELTAKTHDKLSKESPKLADLMQGTRVQHRRLFQRAPWSLKDLSTDSGSSGID